MVKIILSFLLLFLSVDLFSADRNPRHVILIPINEGAGTIAKDVLGRYYGVITNGTWVLTKYGHMISFVGTGKVATEANTISDFGDNFYVAANVIRISGGGCIAATGPQALNGWVFSVNANGFLGFTFFGVGSGDTTNGALALNKIYRAGMAIRNTKAYFYVNGRIVEIITTNPPIAQGSKPMWIGQQPNTGAPITAYISKFKLYNEIPSSKFAIDSMAYNDYVESLNGY